MRIAFGQAYFISNSKGGTEQYTYLILQEFIRSGHEVFVFTFAEEASTFEYHGIKVHQEIKAGKANEKSFKNWLQRVNPQVYHQHTLTPEMDVNFLEIAKGLKISTCLSLHLASATCIRGSMILNGTEMCDGKLDEFRCMSCFLQRQGYSSISQKILPRLISITRKVLSARLIPKSFQVFFNKKRQVQQMIQYADRIFVFANWQKNVLDRNFVKFNQFIKIDHPVVAAKQFVLEAEGIHRKMKCAYIGRVTVDKGLQILVNYFVKHAGEDLELHIYPIFDAEENEFAEELKAISVAQKSICWHSDFDPTIYASVDAVVVPSMVMETGPMVVLEAMQANKIIVASNRIGNADKLGAYNHAFLFDVNVNAELDSAMNNALKIFRSGMKVVSPLLSSPADCAKVIVDSYSQL